MGKFNCMSCEGSLLFTYVKTYVPIGSAELSNRLDDLDNLVLTLDSLSNKKEVRVVCPTCQNPRLNNEVVAMLDRVEIFIAGAEKEGIDINSFDSFLVRKYGESFEAYVMSVGADQADESDYLERYDGEYKTEEDFIARYIDTYVASELKGYIQMDYLREDLLNNYIYIKHKNNVHVFSKV